MPASHPRRRLIVYGSCQAQQLGRIFEASPNVRARFDVRVQWVGDQATDGPAWAHEILQADIILVQDVPELTAFPPQYWHRGPARIVTYPFLTLSALWPFDTAFGEFDPALVAAHKEGRGHSFQFQDRLLALMRRHIPDHDARFEAYRALSGAAHPDIAAHVAGIDPPAHMARNIGALLRKDRQHGLSVGGGIAAQCMTTQVFHSVAHPTMSVLARLAGELMGKLDVSLEPDCLPEDGFATLQVPVHPVVAARLGLQWPLQREAWNVQGEWLGFERYYRRYIEMFG